MCDRVKLGLIALMRLLNLIYRVQCRYLGPPALLASIHVGAMKLLYVASIGLLLGQAHVGLALQRCVLFGVKGPGVRPHELPVYLDICAHYIIFTLR